MKYGSGLSYTVGGLNLKTGWDMMVNLLFDDTALFRKENLIRCSTQPEMVACFGDDEMNMGPTSGFVLKQPDGSYRMFYSGIEEKNSNNYHHHILTAVSNDGIHFVKDTGAAKRTNVQNPFASHQLLTDFPHSSEIVAVVEDPFAPAYARYKMLVAIFNAEQSRMYNHLLVSPDTLHWTMNHTMIWHSRGAEPVGSCCYDAMRHNWMIATRPDWGDRRIAMVRTADWESYSAPYLVLAPDSLDSDLAEFYGMNVFAAGNLKLGLLLVYSPGNRNELCHKYMGGRIDCELVFSHNGDAWQRSLRTSWVGAENTMFIPATVRTETNSHIIYGYATPREHGDFAPKELCTSVKIYQAKRNRFVSLKTIDDVPALLAFRECVWHGGALCWNLRANHATAAIYDMTEKPRIVRSHEDCIPFSGDSIRWTPAWKGHENCDDLIGKLVVFELRMENGEVWSVEGDYTLLRTTEAVRFRRFGTIPSRIGF